MFSEVKDAFLKHGYERWKLLLPYNWVLHFAFTLTPFCTKNDEKGIVLRDPKSRGTGGPRTLSLTLTSFIPWFTPFILFSFSFFHLVGMGAPRSNNFSLSHISWFFLRSPFFSITVVTDMDVCRRCPRLSFSDFHRYHRTGHLFILRVFIFIFTIAFFTFITVSKWQAQHVTITLMRSENDKLKCC